MRRLSLMIIGLALALSSFAALVIVRYSHIDMTDLRFAAEYWDAILISWVGMFLGGIIYATWKKQGKNG